MQPSPSLQNKYSLFPKSPLHPNRPLAFIKNKTKKPPTTTSNKTSKDSDVYFGGKALVFCLISPRRFLLDLEPEPKTSRFTSQYTVSWVSTTYLVLPHPTLACRCLHPTCGHLLAEVGREGSSSMLSSEVSPPASLNSIAST